MWTFHQPATRRIWRRIALGLALFTMSVTSPLRPAPAQGAPSIDIPAEIRVPPAVVSLFQVQVSRADDLAQKAMLLVRGLPPRVTLSEGRSFSPGVWAVPVAKIGRLEIAPATGTVGRSELTLQLLSLDGRVLADASTVLVIDAAGARQKTSEDAGKDNAISLTAGPLLGKPRLTEPSPPATASYGLAAKQLTEEEVAQARKLVERGNLSMSEGKIAAARLFYQSAAEKGWAPAALALAETYDSRELYRSKVVGGIEPDPALARTWYLKAKELGSAEAERRLQELGGR